MNEHATVQHLIPWYVNGSLDERDMSLVSQHLKDCRECADEIRASLGLTRAMNAMDDPLLARLLEDKNMHFAALDRQIAVEARHKPDAAGIRRAGSRGMAALAAGVLLTLGLGVVVLVGTPGSTYEAMTTSPAVGGPVLQLIFHPETYERDIRLLLLETEGELLGTPSPKGVYRVAVPNLSDPVAYAARLRGHPAVRWVEVER